MNTLAAIPVLVSDLRLPVQKSMVLIGAVMVQLILGTVYGYSIFWQPLEAELWPPILIQDQAIALTVQDEQVSGNVLLVADIAAFNRERENRLGVLKYAFAICLLSFATSTVVAGRLQDVRGPRFTATVGGVVLGAAFLLAGFMNSLAVFYVCHAVLMGVVAVALLMLFEALTRGVDPARMRFLQYIPFGFVTVVVVAGIPLGQEYISTSLSNKVFLLWGTVGLLAGLGTGFAYVCPIAALLKWFPQNKGLVSGLAVAGFGLGAYLISGGTRLGGVGYIEANGIENFFRLHGLIAALGVCGGALLLRNPPILRSPRMTQVESRRHEHGWRQLLRYRPFYLVWIMFFSGAMAGLMVIGILKPFAGSQLIHFAESTGGITNETVRSDLLLRGAAAVGVLAVFNALGRVIWGLISDRIGRSVTMTLMFVFQGLTLLSLATLDSETELAIGAACVGFNFGGNFALFPSLTADLFGTKNFGANYGWVFTSYGVAGVFGVWVGNFAQQVTGSYFAAFATAALLCFFSAGLSLVIGRSARAPAAA
jgi:OFA family oxalate/formate antiporter-like MFS transporter